MNKEEFNELADKVANGSATDRELSMYSLCFDEFQREAHWTELEEDSKSLRSHSWNKIIREIEVEKPKVKRWPRITVAAALLVMAAAGLFIKDRFNGHPYGADVAPGKMGATLSFEDGSKIVLDQDKAGLSIGKELNYYDGTDIQVSHGQQKEHLQPQMLSATTLPGQTYRFTLPDGTKVWLNAASKISFPTIFAKNERKVKLVGEAYFEVVHQDKQPFSVESNKQVVQDIGTAFNITAYPDDTSIKTTIVEGAAEVKSAKKRSGPLIAGQQAILSFDQLAIHQVDVNDEIDWKSGLFIFKSEALGNLMTRVARWYDIKVVFEDTSLRTRKFSGTISRYDHISKLLEILQTTGALNFKIEGKTIYINQ